MRAVKSAWDYLFWDYGFTGKADNAAAGHFVIKGNWQFLQNWGFED